MRQVPISNDTAESHQEVARRLLAAANQDRVAHVRAVVAKVDGEWRLACGRIDVARQEDVPDFPSKPIGNVRLLFETLPMAELLRRLESAFRGEPFEIANMPLEGHGMDSAWKGSHHPGDWSTYGASWPIVCLFPDREVKRRLYLYEVIEAEGDVGAYDGSAACLRAVMGFRDSGAPGADGRFSRFQIIEWDYRGVMHSTLMPGMLKIVVKPPDAPHLRLALVMRDSGKTHARTVASPSCVEIPIQGELNRLNMTLRSGEEILCEALWDGREEQLITQFDGHCHRSPSAPQIIEPEHSTIAKLAFNFLADEDLADLIARDLMELDAAIRGNAHKAAVLLVGSILEAALLDVLGRNQAHARLLLGKNWPDKASLKALIEATSSISVTMPDMSHLRLLPPLTSLKGLVITDHRDLIHPRAEIRGASVIDHNTVSVMKGVLGEIMRDLRWAFEQGVLEQYEQGRLT